MIPVGGFTFCKETGNKVGRFGVALIDTGGLTIPYFCYIHQGLYVNGPVEGCNDTQCLEFARKEVRPSGIHYTGHGGSDQTKISRHNSKTFHKDMYAYKDAVDQGVDPEMITVKASEKALKEAEAVSDAS